MDVLWGAWIKDAKYNDENRTFDFTGIYDQIWKDKKSDFPFVINLMAVLNIEASIVEFNKTYQITLEIIDLDAHHRLYTSTENLIVESGDTPFRWYDLYLFENIEFKEPGYYELSISINQQFKQRIPLWIIAPKLMLWEPEKDITTEMWPDDYDFEKNEPR
jgi:hypothetical protein